MQKESDVVNWYSVYKSNLARVRSDTELQSAIIHFHLAVKATIAILFSATLAFSYRVRAHLLM